jgi:hypothetical protein
MPGRSQQRVEMLEAAHPRLTLVTSAQILEGVAPPRLTLNVGDAPCRTRYAERWAGGRGTRPGAA